MAERSLGVTCLFQPFSINTSVDCPLHPVGLLGLPCSEPGNSPVVTTESWCCKMEPVPLMCTRA